MLLVRHGHAGTKEGWEGDDLLRPLDARGMRQARRLVEVLVPLEPNHIVSSPYLRCLQTMEPLAMKTGLEVTEDAGLTPNAGAGAVDLVRTLSTSGTDRVVVCTHGEVM
jgi:8-oxo-(d)GTP phosphatase